MIKVYDKIEMKNIEDIKPYWRNPRLNDKTVESLKKVIPVVGFNVPLYIDSEGVIIKGHARYRASVQLGLKQLPCIVSTNSDEQNRLDRIADNKVSELAEWDIPELRYELEQIDFNLEDIGFDLPKNDFMENMYSQEDFKEVTPQQMNKAVNKVLGFPKESEKVDFNEIQESEKFTTDVQQAKDEKKYIKVNCPKCGEEIVVYAREW